MPKDLQDFPRPPRDNGRGLHGSLDTAWRGGKEGYDYWIRLLGALGVKWFKVVDSGGNSIALCAKLLDAGIFPIVRMIRRDPPPNDTPEPNPGHLGAPEEKIIQRLIDAGVRYFETNTEPDRPMQWKQNAIPGNSLETAKIAALNWLFDARFILSAGGYPGVPAVSSGNRMDLMGALVTLGRQDILLEGCWIALHNECQNRPVNFPDDPVNRAGQTLTLEHYTQGAFTEWAWWNTARQRADTLEEVNAQRTNSANPNPTIQQDHTCFREFEYFNSLATKYLGRSIPIISTEGGYHIGHREDLRYPRITPDAHRDQTIALFDFMQRQAPDYYFAAVPTLLIESDEREMEAWHSGFWQRAFKDAPFGFDFIPTIPVPGVDLGDRLPVIAGVTAMQNLARRLPGVQPAPPVQPGMPFPPFTLPEKMDLAPQPLARSAPPTDFPSWLRDAPPSKSTQVEETIAQPEIAPEHVTPTFTPPEEIAFTLPMRAEPVAVPDDLEWDWRLDALGVSVEPAQVTPGQAYWKLARAIYQSPVESNEQHQVFYTVVDQQNNPVQYHKVWQGWTDGATDALTNDQGEANIPLWAAFTPERDEHGIYTAWVDGLPSDRVGGIGLPLKQHVSFRLTWKRAIASSLY